jgi:hypothetical protein
MPLAEALFVVTRTIFASPFATKIMFGAITLLMGVMAVGKASKDASVVLQSLLVPATVPTEATAVCPAWPWKRWWFASPSPAALLSSMPLSSFSVVAFVGSTQTSIEETSTAIAIERDILREKERVCVCALTFECLSVLMNAGFAVFFWILRHVNSQQIYGASCFTHSSLGYLISVSWLDEIERRREERHDSSPRTIHRNYIQREREVAPLIWTADGAETHETKRKQSRVGKKGDWQNGRLAFHR